MIPAIIITALVFILMLSVLVLIHEFGHFFVAKRLGIKVEEFGFGFPPRVFGIKRGETIYSINALPIGGFVKLYGEDDAGGGKVNLKNTTKETIQDIKRAFFARPASQRAAVVVAGVLMNVILAAAIYYVFLFVSGFKTELPLIGNHSFFLVHETTVSDIIIDKISKNSPAEKIGIKPIAKILAVNNQKITSSEQFVTLVDKNKGKKIEISWQEIKSQKDFTASIIPRVSPPKNEGALGVEFFPVSTAELSYNTPLEKLFSGIIHPFNLLWYNLDLIGQLVHASIKEHSAAPISDNVAGPVGIFGLVQNLLQISDIKERILQILNLAGILSISLAFFNVLPIPALDGGRLFFIVFEMLTRKKVSPDVEAKIHNIGFAILVMLILLITYQDVSRFISGRGTYSP